MGQTRGNDSTYLLVPIALLAALLATAVIRGPSLVSQSGFGSAVIVAAPLILATYALMATTIAGRATIDLAIGPLVAFINVMLVQLNGLGAVTSPIGVFVVALGLGILYEVIFALIIIYVRVQPIIVALSGFLALSGLNLIILPRPGGSAPMWMSNWGSGDTIFSPILVIILIATGGWLLLTATTFYSNLRMMGYDERAAYTAGVRIYLARIGAHVLSGIFAGLSAICYTALIGSGDPTRGSNLTLTAVTALVLGGAALSGGRSSVTGALMGALVLYLIGYVLSTFSFGATQGFVTQLSYGVILVLSLLLTLLVPVVQRHISFISPYGMFVVLGTAVLGLMLQITTQQGHVVGAAVSGASTTAAKAGLMQRYFLLPGIASAGAAGSHLGGLSVNPLLQILFATVVLLGVVTLTVRVTVAEAAARRRGAFLYVVVGVLIVLVFLTFAGIGDAHAMVGKLQRQAAIGWVRQ